MQYAVSIFFSLTIFLFPLSSATRNGAGCLSCKRVTFKKLSWLFRARTQCPVRELGIEIPFLVLELAGYACSLGMVVFNTVAWFSTAGTFPVALFTVKVYMGVAVITVLADIIFDLIWGR